MTKTMKVTLRVTKKVESTVMRQFIGYETTYYVADVLGPKVDAKGKRRRLILPGAHMYNPDRDQLVASATNHLVEFGFSKRDIVVEYESGPI